MIYYHITEKSSNKKTGPIPVVTSSRKTCSDTCPFKDDGCYGDGGPIRLHWEKVTHNDDRALTFREFVERIPKVAERVKRRGVNRIRLWQVGDMPGPNRQIYTAQVKRLVKSLSAFDMPFGYTHKPMDRKENRDIIRYCNDNGVTINLSANNPTHADYLLSLGIGPVSVTLPEDLSTKDIRTPEDRRIIICPAVLSEKVTCSSCGGNPGPLCWRRDREFIVGFPAHGFRVRKASEVARETKVRY